MIVEDEVLDEAPELVNEIPDINGELLEDSTGPEIGDCVVCEKGATFRTDRRELTEEASNEGDLEAVAVVGVSTAGDLDVEGVESSVLPELICDRTEEIVV